MNKPALNNLLLPAFSLVLFFTLAISCSGTKKDRKRQRIIMQVELPANISDSLPEIQNAFDQLGSDTIRLSYLLRMSDTVPFFRLAALRQIMGQEHDSVTIAYKAAAIFRYGKYKLLRNHPDSITYYYSKISDELASYNNQFKWRSFFCRELGSFYLRNNRYADGILLYDKAITIAEKNADLDSYMTYLSELGRAYLSIGDPDRALSCYLKGKEYGERSKNYSLTVYCLNSLGDLCRNMNHSDKAIKYHKRALQVHSEDHRPGLEYWAATSIGKAFNNLNQHDSALKYFDYVIREASKSNLVQLTSQAWLGKANTFYKTNKLQEAFKMATTCEKLADSLQDKDIQSSTSLLLSMICEKSGRYPLSLKYYKRYKILEDSLENQDQVKKIAEAEFREKEEKLVNTIEQKNEKLRSEKEKGKLRSRKQQLIIILVSVGFLFISIFSIFIYRGMQTSKKKNLLIEKQKKLVEEKQKEIVDSIYYANKIQMTLFPSEKKVAGIINRLRNIS